MEHHVPSPASLPMDMSKEDASIAPGNDVIDAEGRVAKVVAVHRHQEPPTVSLKMDSRQEMILPLALLEQKDGSLRLSQPFAALFDAAEKDATTTIPVWSEQLHVNKRRVDTGKGVRIHKNVVEHDETVNIPLLREELLVERVPIQKIVTGPELPAPRQEGDVYIVPVLEEVLVVEKKIRLKEEVRITKHRHELPDSHTVRVKSEQVSIEKFDESGTFDKQEPGTSHLE